jgi:bifunctional NMN adenylyltransferase/nudix hydrolase
MTTANAAATLRLAPRIRPQPRGRYDALVFIGRFRPFHLGHKRVVDRALSLGETVIMLIGSANTSPSVRNPFSHEDVVAMISAVYPEETGPGGRLILMPLEDHLYNDTLWLERSQALIGDILNKLPGNTPRVTLHGWADFKIALIGCHKDNSSYYLKLFPSWASEAVEFLDPINATDIRQAYFGAGTVPRHLLPDAVADWLEGWKSGMAYDHIKAEADFVARYRSQFAGQKYAPSFNCADAVVSQSGHVLLVRRKAMPGKGQLALPGGFIQEDETALDAAIRELKEETRLKLPRELLTGSVAATRTFDNPFRSTRGRTYSHAFHFRLPDRPDLPIVKGGDDAAEAFWRPIGLINPKDMFEDHWHIINHFMSAK